MITNTGDKGSADLAAADALAEGALTDATSPGHLAQRPSSGHSIALMAEPGALAAEQLGERRLIHRDAPTREHSDAFREIRTRLLGLAGESNFVTLVVAAYLVLFWIKLRGIA